MGRRRRSGGGGRSGPFSNLLRNRIEQCDIKSPTVEQLVTFLRSTHSEYSRQSLQQLTKHVRDALQFINSRKSKSILTDEDDDEEINNDETPPRKKIKKSNSSEEKLKQLEAQHLKKLRTSGDSSASTATNSSSEDDDEEEELSTSEDRIYGEEFEPKFDLMKDMLLENYIQKAKSNMKEKAKEDKLEIEMVNNNDRKVNRKLDVLRKGDQRRRKVELDSRKGEGGGSSGGDGGGNAGPMFKDIGGMSGVIDELIMEVIVPLYHPQLPRHLGVRPMAGILLHGPPGCGKTKLAHAIANETGVPFYKISATELVSGISGASEENIRELFTKAYRTAPSIVFIDEIDAIASKRENLQREMERRIVTQLMTCMDDSNRQVQPTDKNDNSENSDSKPGYILVIGATNRPDAVDPALRRPGRFDREIILGVPDESARIDILSKLTDKLKVEGAFDLVKIARATPGFVGADLAALTHKAGNLAMKRMFDQRKAELSEQPTDAEHAEEWWRQPWSPEQMEKLSITMADFEEAAKLVQPSSRREGFSAIPNVKWEDVGGLRTLREEFNRYIVHRIKYPDVYADFGVDIETGFLLYGPPGCGKTLIAKAVANEAGANFIHVKGPELLNKYVGESELAVRTIFSRARTCSPCILFFDEVDALTTKRGREGGWVVERLLNQLLIELDGAEQRRGVYVIGATNRPEIMDPAVLRPGRFGKLLYVPLPTPDERGLILKAVSRKKPIDPSVDLMVIAKDSACENLSGADLAALMNDAAMAAVQERQTSGDCSDDVPRTIREIHFKQALEKIAPSVSDKQRLHYQLLSESFKFTSS